VLVFASCACCAREPPPKAGIAGSRDENVPRNVPFIDSQLAPWRLLSVCTMDETLLAMLRRSAALSFGPVVLSPEDDLKLALHDGAAADSPSTAAGAIRDVVQLRPNEAGAESFGAEEACGRTVSELRFASTEPCHADGCCSRSVESLSRLGVPTKAEVLVLRVSIVSMSESSVAFNTRKLESPAAQGLTTGTVSCRPKAIGGNPVFD